MEIFESMIEIDSQQSLYNMLERNTDSYHGIPLEYKTEKEVFPHVRQHGQAFLPYSPLFQGLLSGRFKKKDNFSDADIRSENPKFKEPLFSMYYDTCVELCKFSEEIGKPLYEISLNWLRQKPEITSIIAGARSPKQLLDNLHCLTWDLTDDMLSKIDQIIAPLENR